MTFSYNYIPETPVILTIPIKIIIAIICWRHDCNNNSYLESIILSMVIMVGTIMCLYIILYMPSLDIMSMLV